MRLRAMKVEGNTGDFVSIGYVNDVFISEDKQASLGLKFDLPYVFTCRDAAKLAREMEGCIKILDAFIHDGQLDRPQVDIIL